MILVLRALGIGDLATGVPALRGLRAAFPHRPLVLAAPAWLAPLAELTGCVDRLLPVEDLDPSRWSLPPAWLAVNLHGRGPQSHRLLRAGAPRRLYAFRCVPAGHLDGPRWYADEHEVRRWCRLVRWYGVPADPTDLQLRRPAGIEVPAGTTIVHPGGKDPRRRWAPDRFAEVARNLARAGHRVVVTGADDERDLACRVASLAGLPPGAVLAGRLGLAELAALVASARLVVSADTGVAHLATGYQTPSVVLFGPVRPRHWGPPPDRPWHRPIWKPNPIPVWPDPAEPPSGSAGLSGSGRPHPALAAITVADVLDAAEQAERSAREAGTGSLAQGRLSDVRVSRRAPERARRGTGAPIR